VARLPRSREIDRRTFLRSAAAGALGASLGQPNLGALVQPTTIYNGIRLAQPWPPDHHGLLDRPIAPPYLLDPPDVIPIDIGRQLFVDDFLIEDTSLERTFHRTTYHPDNPVLRPTTQWEIYDEYAVRTKTRSNPAAMVFSDGVFFDPQSRLFKMWYMGGYGQHTCYAFSHDGLTWEKPALDVVKGTNITLSAFRDSSTVWLDLAEADPDSRYKMTVWYDFYLVLYTSPDGIHWRERGRSGPAGDRTTFFFNPFRNVWVFSLRDQSAADNHRFRRYWETPDFVSGARWKKNQPVQWTGADLADPPRSDYKTPAELYNLDCVAYESVILGLFTIFRGERPEREKPNDVCVGYSRDGFHWSRPDREAFVPVSEQVGDWNWANVQSAGGCCLVVGDRLHFYVSGRRGVPGSSSPGICSTGLATLRRDGFASMDHPGSGRVERLRPGPPPGTLITRPLRFSGRHLFVNVDAPDGELRVAMLDREGRVIEPYNERACVPIRADSTRASVTWTTAGDLAPLAGRDVRMRFHLTRGRLYAFWVAKTIDGASQGYVAAGGPGFGGPIDTFSGR
jgi:hypothetical protein